MNSLFCFFSSVALVSGLTIVLPYVVSVLFMALSVVFALRYYKLKKTVKLSNNKNSGGQQNEYMLAGNREKRGKNLSYREFAEMLPEIVYECDLKGDLLFVNNPAFETLDVPVEEFEKGLNIFDFIAPQDKEKANKNLQLIAQNKPVSDNKYLIVSRNGGTIPVHSYTLPVYKNGDLKGYRGFLINVTQNLENEETIKVLRDIIFNIDLGLCVFKCENKGEECEFVLEIANKSASGMIRFLNQKNVGKKLNDISPVLKQINLIEHLQEVLSKFKPKEIDDFRYQSDTSYSPYFINLRLFPLPNRRVAIFMEDVTDKRNYEATLKMNTFGVDNAGDIILWLDSKANFTFVNNTACEKYGYSRNELLEMGLCNVDTRINMMQWYELTQILEGKPSITMESINKDSDGELFPVEISINKFVIEGTKRYFAFVRDISDRNKNTELEQKIQVARKSAAIKQQFLANMSHEIRTPMTGIMGMTSLLLKSNLNMAQLEYVNNIRISSENLLSIINDVLDLSKIEAGKMELKPSKINLKEFLKEVKEMYQHKADQKGIKLNTTISSALPRHIIVDKNRLKQLLNNLLSNAFKFTDEGSVSVQFLLKEKMDDRLKIACKVKDTGVGISQENQKRVFDKYTQVEDSLIKKFEGTGLGLAICRELSTLMGGDISVESVLNEGSVFEFTFMADYDHNDELPEVNEAARNLQDFNLRVLHVEDKLLNQKVVGYILINAGATVDFVKNGMEAIDIYHPGKYDIILMDIHMPVMDGITAHKKLRELHGDKLCPVIGLSANALEGDAQKFIELGLDDYIMKPFKPEILYDKLLKWTT